MPYNLRNRSFLRELDFTPSEWRFLLGLAADLKVAKYTGTEVPHLGGRTIALLSETAATRTRWAFEVAAYDQGAHVTSLDPDGSRLGQWEPVADTARALGRCYDGVAYRGSTHDHVERLADHAGVPVWNGRSDEWDPTQSLCDMLTMRDHGHRPDTDLAFAFCGDARSGTGNSLLVAGAMLGMDVRMVAPKARWNSDHVVRQARRLADLTGARITQADDVVAGVHGVDFVCTDGWLPPGEPPDRALERVDLLRPYRVSMDVLRATGNAHVKFMHPLPAHHDPVDALEVTDEVFQSPNSIVFEQAENRLHTVKAVLVATLGG